MPTRWDIKLPSGTKLIALAIAAVALPTIVLFVVQYRSLVELQNKTRAAAHESLRQRSQNIARKVKEDLGDLATQSFRSIDPRDISEENLDQVQNSFAAARQSHPEIDQIFLVSHCGCRGKRFALFYSADAVVRISDSQFKSSSVTAQIVEEYNRAVSVRPPAESKQDLAFAQSGCSMLPGGPADQLQLHIFRPLSSGAEDPPFGFAGIALSQSFIEGVYLPRTMPELLREADASFTGSGLALGIFDEKTRELYSNKTGRTNYEMKTGLGPVFPNWQAAIGYSGTTVEDLARDNFRKGLMLVFFLLSLLILGIALILRATTREMRLAQAKSAFVSNVSHELKTPLALIRLFGETLELDRVKSPEKAPEYYRIITAESRRLTQLIDNILDFSKIEAGRKQYELARCNIADVVEDVLSTYKYQLLNTGFELTADVRRDLPAALIDRDAISQVVLNLVDNAVKYSTDVKKVVVRTLERDGNIIVEVSDSGIGIPRSEHKKIFEKFYRVSTGSVHNTKGSGLGLAVVKHIVEAHRGQVLVESSPGKGSRFTVLIPSLRAEPATEQQRRDATGYTLAEGPDN
jgi:signal transduction histidine kinase